MSIEIVGFWISQHYRSRHCSGGGKGVDLYIDGVYIGTASGSTFDLAEIERIEVRKGAQGTLFGRNSTGGAVSITTRGPRGEFHLKQKITYGNYGQLESRTCIDTPKVGPFSAALTVGHFERRGEIRNLGAGTVWKVGSHGGFLGCPEDQQMQLQVRRFVDAHWGGRPKVSG